MKKSKCWVPHIRVFCVESSRRSPQDPLSTAESRRRRYSGRISSPSIKTHCDSGTLLKPDVSRGRGFRRRSGSRILRGFETEKARGERAPFDVVVRFLGYGCERFYVPELSQQCVLIVVAAARHNSPLLVEVTDFAER